MACWGWLVSEGQDAEPEEIKEKGKKNGAHSMEPSAILKAEGSGSGTEVALQFAKGKKGENELHKLQRI